MSKKAAHVSETPATAWLKARGVAYSEHPYGYLDHGGAQHSATVLGLEPFAVVKTLIMQDEGAKPLAVLMHGNRTVSTKNLARQTGAKKIGPCAPDTAQRHSGYQVGGTSPFATRKRMPVWYEDTLMAYPEIYVNGGRRGYLIRIAPDVLSRALGARPVHVALERDDGRE